MVENDFPVVLAASLTLPGTRVIGNLLVMDAILLEHELTTTRDRFLLPPKTVHLSNQELMITWSLSLLRRGHGPAGYTLHKNPRSA